VANIGTLTAYIGADTRGLQTGLSKAESQITGFERAATSAIAKVGSVIVATFAASKMAGMVKGVTMTAARVEELGVVVENTGRISHYSSAYLAEQEASIKALGITTEASRTLLIRFMQSQLDVADAAKIARAAQDLAVIAQMDSSEAAQTLTYAIAAQRPILLRQFGIVTDLNEIYSSYAKTIGKSAQTLTDVEKRQAAMNVVLEQAARVSGTYEAAMETAGKRYRSLARYTQEAAVAVGNYFLPALSRGVDMTENLMKAVAMLANPLQTSMAILIKQRGIFDESTGSINAVVTRYEELANMTIRTADEQDEYNRVMQKISSIMPNVLVEYDKYGNMLRLNEESLRKQLDAERALLQIKVDKEIAKLTKRNDELNRSLEEQVKYYDEVKDRGTVLKPYYGFTMLYSKELKELIGQEAVFLPLLELAGQWFGVYGDKAEAAKERIEALREEQGKIMEYLRQLEGKPAPMFHGPTLKELAGETPPPIDAQKLLDTQVRLYEDLLDQTGKSRDELLAIWDQYEAVRLKQIDVEAAELTKLGVSADLIKATVAAETAALAAQKGEKFKIEYYAPAGPPPMDLQGWIDETQRWADDAQKLTDNYYTWMKNTQQISSEDYIAYLQTKLEGEQEFSDAWMQIQGQIMGVEKADAEARKTLWMEQHALEVSIYQSIGDTVGAIFSNMAAEGQSFWSAMENAAKAFGSALISILAQWLAKEIANNLISLASHAAMEHLKTEVTLAEAAKRAAANAAANAGGGGGGIGGIAGSIIGIVSMFAHKGGLLYMQGGGPLQGGVPGQDSIPVMATPGEYMFDVPTVRAIGIPALEYMRRQHRVPNEGVSVTFGDTHFNRGNRISDLLEDERFKAGVLRAVKSAIRSGELR
jgi:hypothetical protein